MAARASEAFKQYLMVLRADDEAVATTPPGRFLMPGDLAGSPALTFAPLDLHAGAAIAPGSFAALMERRFEAYKAHVVRPFFRDHFQRIDRQIVLVDVLAAIDAGPVALAELEDALDQVLMAFRTGRNTLLSRLFSPRADKVLFAATKADHIHHTDHDRLDAILRLLVNRAARRTEAAGAKVGTVALASVRATRETTVREGRRFSAPWPACRRPASGSATRFSTARPKRRSFPVNCPKRHPPYSRAQCHRVPCVSRDFRPPKLPVDAAGRMAKMPHIRLDRALEFLLGDRFT